MGVSDGFLRRKECYLVPKTINQSPRIYPVRNVLTTMRHETPKKGNPRPSFPSFAKNLDVHQRIPPDRKINLNLTTHKVNPPHCAW